MGRQPEYGGAGGSLCPTVCPADHGGTSVGGTAATEGSTGPAEGHQVPNNAMNNPQIPPYHGNPVNTCDKLSLLILWQ